jgi:hypothetical protein
MEVPETDYSPGFIGSFLFVLSSRNICLKSNNWQTFLHFSILNAADSTCGSCLQRSSRSLLVNKPKRLRKIAAFFSSRDPLIITCRAALYPGFRREAQRQVDQAQH